MPNLADFVGTWEVEKTLFVLELSEDGESLIARGPNGEVSSGAIVFNPVARWISPSTDTTPGRRPLKASK